MVGEEGLLGGSLEDGVEWGEDLDLVLEFHLHAGGFVDDDESRGQVVGEGVGDDGLDGDGFVGGV